MADAEDRTLAPSERRLSKAREDGQAPVSRELVTLAGLGMACLVLMLGGSALTWQLGLRLRDMLTMGSQSPEAALRQAAKAWAMAVGPLMVGIALAGAGSVLLQTNFLIHGKGAMPDLARLDPRRGLKRVFGPANLAEAVKSLAKVSVLAWSVYSALTGIWPLLPHAAAWETPVLMDRLGRELIHLTFLIFVSQAGIALLDVLWTRWRFTQRLRMSREDHRQEHRESDGDPQVKARLRQIRQARSRRRMMAAVPKATVVITNPTHYAIALAYERGTQAAPKVVAKGVDEVAARIREAAQKAGVPLVANPPLARALYTVKLDAEVPAEHFRVVAEIIAYVWRLRTAAAGGRPRQ